LIVYLLLIISVIKNITQLKNYEKGWYYKNFCRPKSKYSLISILES
jgi:hypothetical protein